MNELPVIIDTDPGIDDAIALLVANKYLKDKVKLIIASYGNITVDIAARNALTILELLNSEVPVIKGAEKSQGVITVDAKHIHGADGLGDVGFIPSKKSPLEVENSIDYTYNFIKELGSVDYITLGPLTNLALLLKKYPDVKKYINSVTTMGGGIGIGNVTPFAEFNIYCDAVSAEEVFCSGLDITVVPLNITNRVAFLESEIEQIRKEKNHYSDLLCDMLLANYKACKRYGEDGSTMHDSTAVLAYAFPEIFSFRACGLSTVVSGEHTGETEIGHNTKNIKLTIKTDIRDILDKIRGSI